MKSLIDSVLQIELRLERYYLTQFSETLWRQEKFCQSNVDRARTGRGNEKENIETDPFSHGLLLVVDEGSFDGLWLKVISCSEDTGY